ncbi:hypothetical protein GP486_002004 [Trichoglossum hirsutum]|uniref:ABC transporter domain-containing protein n=1 Tax=Trichoglossum hirsutum TaxID=265104 RepID=A0A9P8LFX8_9PEZI|nr:hypothetical protein GP486_002004 [Trichoglossum hirsutum]
MGSFDRIQAFLLAASQEDTRHVSDDPISNNSGDGTSGSEVSAELQSARLLALSGLGSLAARLEEVDVRPSASSNPALRGITMAIKRGSKTMVVGPVGSGKSTLLKALLGELPCDRGSISVMTSRIAYCAQTPWLLNTRIRDIICGTSEGSVIDEEWYKIVLNACALDQDLLQFPDGDQSIIGSRGLTLSGGQKQRLALARAVYFRADMILLDDVLSELDGKTEEIVVQKLLGPQGLFGKLGATLILATHAVRHLPLADEIVVLTANGEIAQQGSYTVLRSADGFVGSILTEPARKPVDDSSGGEIKSTSALLRPPSDEQAQDLTRRIGDIAIYRYYLMSIGWAHALVFLAFIFVYIFALKFPQVIIKWWTDAKGGHMGVFMSTYIALSMLMRIAPASAAKLHYTLLRTVMRSVPQASRDAVD